MRRLLGVHSIIVGVALTVLVFCGGTATASAQAHYGGALGPGSLYEIDVPATWNGDLVLYAHAIVQASLPVARRPTRTDTQPCEAICSPAASPSRRRATRATDGPLLTRFAEPINSAGSSRQESGDPGARSSWDIRWVLSRS
jgi:hypothetical protein